MEARFSMTSRRTILAGTMLGCRGRVQRANGVIHLIVEEVENLIAEMKLISGLDAEFPLTAGRGDEAKHGGAASITANPSL
jgi:error-prone DNA polymerase